MIISLDIFLPEIDKLQKRLKTSVSDEVFSGASKVSNVGSREWSYVVVSKMWN